MRLLPAPAERIADGLLLFFAIAPTPTVFESWGLRSRPRESALRLRARCATNTFFPREKSQRK